MTDYKAEYDLAEKENKNLREILRWALPHLDPNVHGMLKQKLERTIEHGGVTRDSKDDRDDFVHELKKLLEEIVATAEAVVDGEDPNNIGHWHFKMDALLSRAREYEEPRQATTWPTLADIRRLP